MHTILETLTKKNSLQNLTMFNGGLFELEILEIFTTVFFLKAIVWTWIIFKYFRVLFLKTKKKSCQKSWKPARKLADIARGRRKTAKNGKKSNNSNKYFFYFYFFIQKNIYFVGKHIWKIFMILHLYYSLFRSQFIGNAIIKYQLPYRYALVL